MTTRRPATRVEVQRDGARRFDEVVTEEPLQIRVNDVDLAVTMRTPGNDFELAAGFLVGEGHVRGKDDIAEVKYCVGPDAVQDYNVVTVVLRTPFTGTPRATGMPAACGLRGKRSIDEVPVVCDVLPPTEPIALGEVVAMPDA